MNWSLRKESLNSWPGFSDKTLVYTGNTSAEKQWDEKTQAVVVAAIENQYSTLGLNKPASATAAAIDSLKVSTVKTVTTGHQLQLFGGPAFLHYKTIATIRKARALEAELGTPVVPIFWMATEDHDFEEISWVWGREKKFIWDYPSSIKAKPVGTLPLTGLRGLAESWFEDANLAPGDAETILSSLTLSESNNESYAQFFHRLMHAWYGDSGLIVLDAADAQLKALAKDLFSDELGGRGIAQAVRNTSKELQDRGIKVQAHIREISLFHLGESRVGIIDPSKHVNTPPSELSPNVLLRPLYQELFLPNHIVVLGPGEAAYWQQLSGAFTQKGLKMPHLHLRDHALWLSANFQALESSLDTKLDTGLDSWPNLDALQSQLIDSLIKEKYSEEFKAVESAVAQASDAMSSIASDLDRSLEGAKGAAESGMLKSWKAFLKKAKRTFRRNEAEALAALESTVREVVREGSPQDRWANFHVLSSCIGGFVNSREKLLETHKGLEPVKIVFVEGNL